jgi:hypothetical protein
MWWHETGIKLFSQHSHTQLVHRMPQLEKMQKIQ